MKFSTLFGLAMLAISVDSAAVNRPHSKPKTLPSLDVKIERESDDSSRVRVCLTNTGPIDLKLLNAGTILDPDQTEKLHVFQNNSNISFRGIRKHMLMHGPQLKDMLTPLKVDDTLRFFVEAASLHDLGGGVRFDIIATGSIPYAHEHSDKIDGVVTYRSNKLDLDVDGPSAAAILEAYDLDDELEKRTNVQVGCTEEQARALSVALYDCALMASTAQASLFSDDDRFARYFGNAWDETKSAIASRYAAIYGECIFSSAGKTEYRCSPITNEHCAPGVIVYTYRTGNSIVNCPVFYTLPADSDVCYAQLQGTTVLHEMTHAQAIVDPPLNDYGDGYYNAMALGPTEKFNNADTMALYALLVFMNCD